MTSRGRQIQCFCSIVHEKHSCTGSILTYSDVKSTSLGAADMPFVFTSGKYLYLATITLYMFDMAPPVDG